MREGMAFKLIKLALDKMHPIRAVDINRHAGADPDSPEEHIGPNDGPIVSASH
jgi:hypothetical protein